MFNCLQNLDQELKKGKRCFLHTIFYAEICDSCNIPLFWSALLPRPGGKYVFMLSTTWVTGVIDGAFWLWVY